MPFSVRVCMFLPSWSDSRRKVFIFAPLNGKETYEVCMAKKGVVAVDRYLVAGRQLDPFP